MMKDINGKEYGHKDSVKDKNFYSTDRYHSYAGYRHRSTGEVYLLNYGIRWDVTGRVVYDSASDTYENTENWQYEGRSNSTKEHECLLYHIKKVDDDMDNWERIRFNLSRPSDLENGDMDYWARTGSCIELTSSITVPFQKDVHLTNGVVKQENDSIVVHYPPPWPYPKEILSLMIDDVRVEEPTGGIRDYELAQINDLMEV